MTASLKTDWLNLTFPVEALPAVRLLISAYLGEAETLSYGRHTYESSAQWPSGALLCWSEGRREAFLSLNGDSVDFIPLRYQREVWGDLRAVGAKGTRVDVALDDYSGTLQLDDVEAAAVAGNFTGFRLVNVQRPRRLLAGQLVDEGRGVEFGRRGKDGSGRFVQVYDKALESNGEIPSVRLELRTFKQHADQLWQLMASASSDAELQRVQAEAVGGCIDFVERGTETHLDRMPRLAWWASLVQLLGAAPIVVQRVIPPLQRTWEWSRRAVLPSLALVRSVVQSMGFDFMALLEDALDTAEEKISWQRQGRRHLGLNVSECFG